MHSVAELMSYMANDNISWYAIIVWIMIWKGLALWKSSRKNQKYWFIAMFLINAFGVLDILYIFFFSTPIWENMWRKTKRKLSKHKKGDELVI